MTLHTSRYMALALTLSLLGTGTLSLPALAGSHVYRGGTSYTREYRAADLLLQTGQFSQAESRYTAMLRQHPNSLMARSRLSLAQAELYKLDAAEKNARQVLSKDPKNVNALVALGVADRNRTASQDMTFRSKQNDYLTASAQQLERAVRLDPGSPEAHNQLGVTYRFQGRMAEAMKEFERAADLDPAYAEATLNQGIVRLSQGDAVGAKRLYQDAIQLNSHNPMAHYRMGEALVQEGDYHQGIRSLNTALSLDRGNAAIMTKLAEAYGKQGNTAAAVANYRKSIQANPAFMPAYVGLSDLFDSRGDGELAMAELKSALNVNPKYNPARNQLGRLALTVDKPDQAIQYYKESLQQNPQDPEALQGLSQAFSVVAYKDATMGQALGTESDLVSAEQAIQEALKLNPRDLRLHLASLRISQLAGKPAQSQAELQKIVSSTAFNESDEMIQGEAQLALGNYAAADQIFYGLIQKAGKDTDKLLTIGDTLKANGDLERAKDAYQMAAEADPKSLKAQRGIQRIESAQAESQKTLRLAKALNNWRQKGSSIDFYEEALAKNPRQPEARLALAKLYENYKEYAKAASSYQHYIGLMPELSEKDRQHYQKKIAKLQELALKQPTEKHILAQQYD